MAIADHPMTTDKLDRAAAMRKATEQTREILRQLYDVQELVLDHAANPQLKKDVLNVSRVTVRLLSAIQREL